MRNFKNFRLGSLTNKETIGEEIWILEKDQGQGRDQDRNYQGPIELKFV